MWSENRERLLFCLYSEKKSEFDGSKCPIRHSTLYGKIATAMNAHDIPVTGTQCKTKMKKLIQDFNKEYDGSRNTGAGCPEFPYYQEFLTMLKGSATLEPPVCISVGKGLSMRIEGKEVVEPMPQSRGRKRNVKSSNNKTTYNYRSAIVTQASAAQASAPDRLADEVHRLTDMYERKSDAKYDLFKEFVSNFQFKR